MTLRLGALNAIAIHGILVAAGVAVTSRGNAQSISERGMRVDNHVDVFGIHVVAEKVEGEDAGVLVEGFLDDMKTPAISERIQGITDAFYRPLLAKFDAKLGPRMLKARLSRTNPKCKVSGKLEFYLRRSEYSNIIQTRSFSLDDRAPEVTATTVPFILAKDTEIEGGDALVQFRANVATLAQGANIKVRVVESGIEKPLHEETIVSPQDVRRDLISNFDNKFGFRVFVLTAQLDPTDAGDARVDFEMSVPTSIARQRASIAFDGQELRAHLNGRHPKAEITAFLLVISETAAAATK